MGRVDPHRARPDHDRSVLEALLALDQAYPRPPWYFLTDLELCQRNSSTLHKRLESHHGEFTSLKVGTRCLRDGRSARDGGRPCLCHETEDDLAVEDTASPMGLIRAQVVRQSGRHNFIMGDGYWILSFLEKDKPEY